MADSKKNHLNIDGGQIKEDEHVSSYKAIPESDADFRSSKTSIHKSKEKVSADGAEEKLLDKEEEAKIIRVDMADAKYVVGDHRNGDAKIELDANKRQFSGLTKEELMKYAEDPCWVRLRWFMFVLFWVLWLAMLAAAIGIIIQAPKCALPTPKTWYEKGPHVDMSSMESYSEIEKQLPELQKSNVAGIFTYVCKDTYEILDDKPGCITQFKEFLVKAQNHGIKVIVDLVANYVPKTHKWFVLSENRSTEYDAYFTWAKGKDYVPDANPQQQPPNGWVSTFDQPAWTWSDSRREYYLHQFEENQPDLNFHNPKVVEKFDAVIKLWMDAGADGIRLRNARELLVNASLAEEVADSSAGGAGHEQYRYWQHRHTSDHDKLDELLAHWAHVAQRPGATVFTIMEREDRTELYLLNRNTSYLRPPSARPVNVAAPSAASDINKRVKRWPLVQLVDSDAGDEELAVFSMLLPAAPVLAPQQLLPQDGNTDSATFAHVTALRSDHVIEYGHYEVAAVNATNPSAPKLLASVRWMEGHLCYLGVFNPGSEAARANLTSLSMLPASLNVHYVSAAVTQYTNYTIKAGVQQDNVLVPPKSSVVLSFKYKSSVET